MGGPDHISDFEIACAGSAWQDARVKNIVLLHDADAPHCAFFTRRPAAGHPEEML
jgi:hypothetical protein